MLSKEKILEKVQEEALIRHLVPTFKGNLRKKNYKSIFSNKDDRPSMSIYKEDGRWKFKSHNTGHQGDVFALWGYYYGLDCRTNFKEILDKINQEMLLGLDTKEAIIVPATALPIPTGSKNHSISYTTFSSLFLAYWDQFGITKDILDRFNVKQVSKISFISNSGRPLTFHYEVQGKLVASYDIDSRVKLYIPSIPANFCSDIFFKEQKKAFGYKNQTKSDVFGLSQLPEGKLDYILFTAGEKDCMSACARGLHAISLQSENQFPEEGFLQMLRSKTTVLLSCYDNDKAGTNASKRLLDAFGIASIPLPEDVKDLSEYFQKYTIEDFTPLLVSSIESSNHLNVTPRIFSQRKSNDGNTLFHKVENYLSERFEFRFNTVSSEIQIRVRNNESSWSVVNDSELCSNINKHGIKVPMQIVQIVLKSFFVSHYNPIQSYFSDCEDRFLLEDIDYIREISSYVFLEDASEESKEYWYTHLKKWMIRAVRTVFEPYAINKHALILCSHKENIGKSFFCEFLCPTTLRSYYTSNPTVDNTKDSQVALSTNFIINLDEMQQLKVHSSQLKSWLSQTSIKVRLPYEKTDTIKFRIASFVGNTNDIEFLRSGLGYSRWIGIRMVGTKRIDTSSRLLLEKAWYQAYNYYKQSAENGELTTEECNILQNKSSEFFVKSAECELIEKYLIQSNKEEGMFMTTTDILQYIQECVGTTIRLNKISLGKALNELEFKREKYHKLDRRGYWILINRPSAKESMP